LDIVDGERGIHGAMMLDLKHRSSDWKCRQVSMLVERQRMRQSFGDLPRKT